MTFSSTFSRPFEVSEETWKILLESRYFEIITQGVDFIAEADDHTSSDSTRLPSTYDRHLALAAQLRQMQYGGSQMLLKLADLAIESFANRLELLKGLREGQLTLLETIWKDSLDRLALDSVTNENGILDTHNYLHRSVIASCATIALFDLTIEQINQRASLFVSAESTEAETKTDAIFGFRKLKDIEAQDAKVRPGAPRLIDVIQNLHLRIAELRALVIYELKNLRAANPRAYLAILFLILADKFPWPALNCTDCIKFADAHKARNLKGRQNPFEPTPSGDEPLLSLAELDNAVDTIKAKIQRTVLYIPVFDAQISTASKLHGSRSTDQKTAMPKSPDTISNHQDKLTLRALLEKVWKNCRKELAGSSLTIDEMAHWMFHARNIQVQDWAQMNRHNVTFSTVSSHNLSYVVSRERGGGKVGGTGIISPLIKSTDPESILCTVGTIIKAYYDGVSRLRKHDEAGIPWGIDIFKPKVVTPALRKAAIVAANLEEAKKRVQEARQQAREKRRKNQEAREKALEAARQTREEEKKQAEEKRKKQKKKGDEAKGKDMLHKRPDRDPDGAGGTSRRDGPPGGGAGSGSKQGRGGNSSSRTVTQFQGKNGRAMKFADAEYDVLPKDIHLAFYVPDSWLQSDGFSELTLISPGPDFRVQYGSIPAAESNVESSRSLSVSSIEDLRGLMLQQQLELRPLDLDDSDSITTATSSSEDSETRSGFSGSDPSTPSSSVSSASNIPDSKLGNHPSGTPVAQRSLDVVLESSSLVEEQSVDNDVSDTNSGLDETPGHPVLQPNGRYLVENVGIILEQKIAEETVGIVWGGEMILEGADLYLPVVVKMTVRSHGVEEAPKSNHLRAEAAVYEYLVTHSDPKLQITPHYYGLWKDDDGGVMLILDDGGTPPDSVEELTELQRTTLLKKAVSLHEAGILHNDLERLKNIVIDGEGVPYIIDLHTSQCGHACLGVETCKELIKFQNLLGLLPKH
ncbi:hypothetical protein C8J56DRAFT_923771 [Mycena floridula]|nr:hypothetical protein C8J56DRAFT_923771 [Mycena floridula]